MGPLLPKTFKSKYPTIDGGKIIGRIKRVSHMFFPGTFFFVSKYAKNTPKKNAITVASKATFIDKIIGSNMIVYFTYFTAKPYFSNTSFAKSLCMNS